MKRMTFALLFCSLVLGACSTGPGSSPIVLPSPTATPGALATTDSSNPEGEKTQNCGYQWASQDLPELSASFQEAIRALEPKAQASAYVFGENCIRSDGSIASFVPMETDFNVMLHVDDLANEAVLGRWIVKIMQVIENIPQEQITGPRPGRVSIVFQSSTAQSVINFYITQYRELPHGLNHTEVYEALHALQ